jgi:hypothetical protein
VLSLLCWDDSKIKRLAASAAGFTGFRLASVERKQKRTAFSAILARKCSG